MVRAVFTNEKRANRGIRLKRHASAHCHAEIACQIHFMKHHTLFLAIAALAATSCSLQLDSQYGLRWERRIYAPQSEPIVTSAPEAACAEEYVASIEHPDYLPAEATALPESPLDALAAEFQAEEPLQKQRWVLEIPREEIPAIAQPLVDRAADLNEASKVQTRKKFGMRVLDTAARIILGIVLCALAITLGIFALFYAVLGQISWDPNDYGTIAGQYFIAGIVVLVLGLFVMFVGF